MSLYKILYTFISPSGLYSCFEVTKVQLVILKLFLGGSEKQNKTTLNYSTKNLHIPSRLSNFTGSVKTYIKLRCTIKEGLLVLINILIQLISVPATCLCTYLSTLLFPVVLSSSIYSHL